MSYAGFWKRVIACIIDILILGFAKKVTGFFLGFLFGMGMLTTGADGEGAGSVLLPLLSSLFSVLMCWLYCALMESSARQATLGKMALGIRVCNLEGQRIGFGTATLRYFGKILSGLLLCIGFLMVAFTQREQGLYDLIAGTLVVNKGSDA